MLDRLTRRLVEDDVRNCNKKLFIKGFILPSRFSRLERYSHAGTFEKPCDDCNDLAATLCKVRFLPDEDFETRMQKVYNACTKGVLSEGVELNNKTKRLIMTKDDYKTVKAAIKTYKTLKGKNEVEEFFKAVSVIRSFVKTIKSNIVSADDNRPVDSFINSLINDILKVVCDEKYIKKNESNTKDIILAKIYMINKELNPSISRRNK